ncbi:hypothetical protein Mpal_1527 [Methanosphaerula palustris E1-9c]|uniref:Uncharacterized protein n=1 Tax=Methanosphaerula palustris (strain ATCC BAA-1556 / DSM 19958 / E1-9c) TaxID=521011 RepID=B8GIM8_METPE|nr:hypothetical protein Mpal_1527 [Methanosphaerula palustris E1-9c]
MVRRSPERTSQTPGTGKGPLIRFVLIASPVVSELLVFAAHDRTALANLVRDILTYYADPLRHRESVHPPLIKDFLPEKNRFSPAEMIKNVFIHHWNRQWRKKPHYFDQADFCAVHAAYWEKYRYRCVLLELEHDAIDELTSRCRQRGVTITTAMTAAFLAAYEDVAGPLDKKDRSIAIPFDLRRHLGVKENFFCFFVGGFQFRFAYNQKKQFWENVQNLHWIISSRVQNWDNSSPVMGRSIRLCSMLSSGSSATLSLHWIPSPRPIRSGSPLQPEGVKNKIDRSREHRWTEKCSSVGKKT